jgi:hypothetical protein
LDGSLPAFRWRSPTSRRYRRNRTSKPAFDNALGTQVRAPRDFAPDYSNPLYAQIAQIANGANGRIGVAAIDLSTGQEVAILATSRSRWRAPARSPLPRPTSTESTAAGGA